MRHPRTRRTRRQYLGRGIQGHRSRLLRRRQSHLLGDDRLDAEHQRRKGDYPRPQVQMPDRSQAHTAFGSTIHRVRTPLRHFVARMPTPTRLAALPRPRLRFAVLWARGSLSRAAPE